jgi:hypothetical protein
MNSPETPQVFNRPITSVTFSISLYDLIKCRLWVINHNRFLIGLNIFFSLFIPWNHWSQPGLEGKSIGEKTFVFVFMAVIVFCFITLLNVLVQILYTVCGKNQGVLGSHEFEIRDACLFEKTEVNESSYNWSGFRKFESSPNFFFLYVAGNLVHYIPKRCFASNMEAQQFQELILSKVRKK